VTRPLLAVPLLCALACGDNLPGAAVDASIDARAGDADAPAGHCGDALCLEITAVHTAADIGRGQGIEWREDRLYLYGDRGIGVIREYELDGDSALYTGLEMALTEGGLDRVSHPTGLTRRPGGGAFLGDTVGGRGRIFAVDWSRLLTSRTLDGAILFEVEDGAAVNGSRPELVAVHGRPLLASSDYGEGDNALRLYDPDALDAAADTLDPGVLVASIPVGSFVQSLAYDPESDLLVLVQNTSRASGWRLTFLELGDSLDAGEARTRDVIDLPFASELEGFHFIGGDRVVLLTDEAADNLFFGRLRPAP
jgi:hypothetical protein